MASGSAGRANSGSKGFDFGSDDILCTYDDFAHQDSSNGSHSDVMGTNSSKDFHKTRMARSSAYPASSYNQPEDSFNPDMISVVERTMKKHNDNLMRFLEGISSRLSQLELHCYNLDKSFGEMRADLGRDHEEADAKLKTLEKHIQEVHRSVQILRDKQELADTQKELAKLQLVHKESSSSSQSEEKASSPAADLRKSDNMPETHSNQLAIDLPHKILPPQQPAPVPQPSQSAPQNVPQQQSYYMPPAQISNPPAQSQHHQGQYMSRDPQGQTPQAPQPVQTQINQTPPGQQFRQYQQPWPQQLQAPQQPSIQPQMRPSLPLTYPTYPPLGQPTNSTPSETQPSVMPMPQPNSMPMQVSYAAVPQPISSRADTMPYGYGAGRVPVQPGTMQIKGNYGAQLGDGYADAGPHSALPPVSAYMMYDSEGGRTAHAHHPAPQQAHFPQGAYPPPNLSLQTPQPAAGSNMLPRNPSHLHFVRNHPYSELVDKLVSMGFRGDHVMSVIQRMDESGQPVDFNAVLDRLSTSSGVSQRGGWSG